VDNSHKNYTIEDIAKKANVTNITVSRAFNKPNMVKAETRDKIHAIARELNYVPNAFAQGLKKSSSQIIGIVTSSMYNPFYSELIKTVSRIARMNGYQIMLFDSDGSVEAENEALQTLFSYKARGILLSAVRDDKDYQPDYVEIAELYNIPLILIDRDLYNKNLNGVFLDNENIGRLTGEFLAKQPWERILILAGPENSEITLSRISGIRNHLNENRITIINGDYDFLSQAEEVKKYLSSMENKPDCIIGLNGPITLGAISICHQLGIYDDTIFFAVDEPPKSSDYGINIPGVYHDTKKLGEIAAEILFEMIKTPQKKRTSKRLFFTGVLRDF